MKKLFGIILFMIAFAMGADVKPFTFDNIAQDSASQQNQFDYMLQYKLYGHDFIKMGNDVRIPDKSGWNGTVGDITSNARLTLGGPILANGSISMGDGVNNITGPVRAVNFNLGNVNGSKIASPVCLSGTANSNAMTAIEDHKTYSFDASICKDSVPVAPTNLYMPIVDWDNLGANVKLNDIVLSGNDAADTIFVPKGEGAYKILIDKIQFGLGGTNASHLYVKMQDGGRLTQIFVKNFIYGNHATIQVVYDTDSGSVVLNQDQYRGNLMFYSNNVISFDNMDYAPIQGSFISTDSIFLGRNVNISGQLLATQPFSTPDTPSPSVVLHTLFRLWMPWPGHPSGQTLFAPCLDTHTQAGLLFLWTPSPLNLQLGATEPPFSAHTLNVRLPIFCALPMALGLDYLGKP